MKQPKRKLIDSSQNVSLGGRADDYALKFDFQPLRYNKNLLAQVKDPCYTICKTYKLRGIEFGNYVPIKDRYDLLNALLSCLQDTKNYLKIKNIGFNHKIGIALGARGNGGLVAAHYEPGYNIINLTKNRGDGAFAHEYGHALDYNFGAYVDRSKKYVALSGGSVTAAKLNFPEGGDLRKVVNEIVNQIRELNSDRIEGAKNGYWFKRTEIFARYFEQLVSYILYKKEIKNRYIAHGYLAYTRDNNYLTNDMFQKVLPKGFRMLKLIQDYLD